MHWSFADFCDEEEHEHCLQITIGGKSTKVGWVYLFEL